MTTTSAPDQTRSETTKTGGPGLPQERRLVTEIPGPRSLEKIERRGNLGKKRKTAVC